MARHRPHRWGCRGVRGTGDGRGGGGKPLTVARLLADETTAAAIEADLLAYYRADVLDLYRGQMSLRRVCVLVAGLPPEARLYRVGNPEAAWTRSEVLLLAVERRITALWRDVVTALGATVKNEHTTPPVLIPDQPAARQPPLRAETASLRSIAHWMRS
ncbi:hypothetical protein [Saccharopolyspora hattusasensis]|uniref:hypothetical protein n=1 Tax=Saccharopolyspora hattusasensis TaxID=1128679 RepID=UPI003D976ACB